MFREYKKFIRWLFKDMIKGIEQLMWYPLLFKTTEELKTFLYTINTQGFKEILLEKDFYLTVLLHRIAREIPEITFKGGTCLNRVYFPYFRLSEDLDFSISIENPRVNTNGKRQKFAYHMREKMKEIGKMMDRKLNDDDRHHQKAQGNTSLKSKEYTYLKYVLSYTSIFNQKEQTIKIEITYTNKQHLPWHEGTIHSIFIDPILEEPIFGEISITCLALEEMMAEKMRAALTRQTPAIRDFFDIRYVKKQWFDFASIKQLIHDKVSESEGWYTVDDYYDALRIQIESDLDPVLWKEYPDFDFDQIYAYVLSFKEK